MIILSQITFVLFVLWNEVHTGEVSNIGKWIQFGRDCKDWKCKNLKLKWCDKRIWLWDKTGQQNSTLKLNLIDGWFVWKSPGKRVIVIDKLGKARNENGEENHPANKLHELIVRICINYIMIIIIIIIIIIYRQSECIDKYQIKLCSKYNREYDFDVILRQVIPWCKLRWMPQTCNDVVWQVLKH